MSTRKTKHHRLCDIETISTAHKAFDQGITTRWIAVLCLVLATSAWGGLFYAGKKALTSLDPFWFTVVRYAGATFLLACVQAFTGGIRWRETRANAFKLLGFGLLGYGMFGIMVFIGLSKSLPSHEAVIMATMPLTTLFIRWFFDRQRPQWWAWAGALLAIAGVSLVAGVWNTGPVRGGDTLIGDAIAFVGTLGWIFYTRGQQKLPHLSAIEYTAYTAIVSFPGLVVIATLATLAGLAHVPSLSDVVAVLPSLLYIVVIATVIAALAFNQGVRRLGASNGILFINLVPVSALLIGVVIGQLPSLHELVGTGLVIAALVLVGSRMRPASVGVIRAPNLGSKRQA